MIVYCSGSFKFCSAINQVRQSQKNLYTFHLLFQRTLCFSSQIRSYNGQFWIWIYWPETKPNHSSWQQKVNNPRLFISRWTWNLKCATCDGHLVGGNDGHHQLSNTRSGQHFAFLNYNCHCHCDHWSWYNLFKSLLVDLWPFQPL